jgi:hypothetical protein
MRTGRLPGCSDVSRKTDKIRHACSGHLLDHTEVVPQGESLDSVGAAGSARWP